MSIGVGVDLSLCAVNDLVLPKGGSHLFFHKIILNGAKLETGRLRVIIEGSQRAAEGFGLCLDRRRKKTGRDAGDCDSKVT